MLLSDYGGFFFFPNVSMCVNISMHTYCRENIDTQGVPKATDCHGS